MTVSHDPVRVHVVDSHTGGEPTRVVIAGAPPLQGTLPERLKEFRDRHDRFRAAVVNEPRGSDVMVGALLLTSTRKDCAAATIFFNNVGYLGMCGHGTIGLVATLAWLKRLSPGEHRIETPVGAVKTHLMSDGVVAVENVPAYRYAAKIEIDVPHYGRVLGDIAWGGNWFFLVRHQGALLLAEVERLTEYTWAIRQSLERHGIRGADGAMIDHVELYADAPGVDARNFVLCPGKAYDRSPCGTGTSAKLACLAADGLLAPGSIWRQQSITGSVFQASYRSGSDGRIVPTIEGRAWVTSEATLLLDPQDPLCWGIRAP